MTKPTRHSLILPNGSEVIVDKSHFVAEGAEGKVFALQDTGFKIFHDPSRVIPERKMAELAAIRHPHVIVPTFPVKERGIVVGHAFKFVRDGVNLAEALSVFYRQKHGIGLQETFALLSDIQSSVKAVHEAQSLIVDLGPMNMILHNNTEVYIIDADSFQTPTFPACAVRDVVRDPLAKKFSTNSDWYAFGILAFQLLVGIHPFQGKHPLGGSITKRMAEGRSVLDVGARMPPNCTPLSTLPTTLMEWFRGLFTNTRRCPPPSWTPAVTPIPAVSQVRSSQKCKLVPVFCSQGDAIRAVVHATSQRKHVIHCALNIWVDGRIFAPSRPSSYAVKTLPDGRRVLIHLEQGHAVLSSLDGPLNFDVSALPTNLKDILGCDPGRVLLRGEDTLFELKMTDIRGTIHVTLTALSSISRNATRFRDQVVVQRLAGAHCFIVLQGETARIPLIVPELEGLTVLLASHSNGVIGVTTMDRKQQSQLHLIRLGEFGKYTIDSHPLSYVVAPNFTCLPNKVLALLNEEGELVLSAPGVTSSRVISDTGIEDMRLMSVGSSVWGWTGDGVYAVSLS